MLDIDDLRIWDRLATSIQYISCIYGIFAQPDEQQKSARKLLKILPILMNNGLVAPEAFTRFVRLIPWSWGTFFIRLMHWQWMGPMEDASFQLVVAPWKWQIFWKEFALHLDVPKTQCTPTNGKSQKILPKKNWYLWVSYNPQESLEHWHWNLGTLSPNLDPLNIGPSLDVHARLLVVAHQVWNGFGRWLCRLFFMEKSKVANESFNKNGYGNFPTIPPCWFGCFFLGGINIYTLVFPTYMLKHLLKNSNTNYGRFFYIHLCWFHLPKPKIWSILYTYIYIYKYGFCVVFRCLPPSQFPPLPPSRSITDSTRVSRRRPSWGKRWVGPRLRGNPSLKMNECIHSRKLTAGYCTDLNVPFGVLTPPKMLGKDALGMYPYSCVDGLEKVTGPFKHGHFFWVSMLDFWGVDPENRPSLKWMKMNHLPMQHFSATRC